MKKVYLAGFDVFYPDAIQRGAVMKRICTGNGLIGLYPLDHEADNATDIFHGNLSLIDQCDLLIANLNPFRGKEPDSGTCFEVGYAYARGKKVFGYLSDGRTMREKFGEQDDDGFTIEDFGMTVNLMLGCSVTIVAGEFADCLRAVALNG